MSNDNPILEALLNRRSIRKYTDEAVSREDITNILEAGRWAPSGLNNQPWRFLVIHKNDQRAAQVAKCTKYSKIADAAQLQICVFLERERIYNEMKDHQSIGACLQNMMLAAHSLGLGSVWLGEILNQETQVLEILNIPLDKYELQAVIAVGHPAQKGGSSRKDLSEIMLEDY